MVALTYGYMNKCVPRLARSIYICILWSSSFSNDGQIKWSSGSEVAPPGQLQRPTGIAVDMNGDIIVADYDNRWLSIFSPDGKFKVSYISFMIILIN